MREGVAKSATTTDCISREKAMSYPLSWNHYDKENGSRDFICGVESYREYIESLPPVTPPQKVVAEVKIDTEELVNRIKEECQLGQKHGKSIDADKLLQGGGM